MDHMYYTCAAGVAEWKYYARRIVGGGPRHAVRIDLEWP